MRDLAIIVVSFNDGRWLRPCLCTVFEHAGELIVDVVVADNGSDDAGRGARAVPAGAGGRTPNFGFSYANNRALMTCDARYVLFLNPDTEIVEGTFAELIAALDSRPEVGLAGVRHLTDGRIYPSMRRLPERVACARHGPRHRAIPLSPGVVVRASAGARPLRAGDGLRLDGRRVHGRPSRGARGVRGRSTSGSSSYAEEPDLCRRIKQGGWAVRHLPQMTIIHHAGKAKLNPRMEAQNAYSRLQYARKHFSPAHRATYRLMLILEHALRWTLARARGDRPRRSVAARVVATLTGRDEPPFGPSPAVAVSRRDPVGSVDRPRAR